MKYKVAKLHCELSEHGSFQVIIRGMDRVLTTYISLGTESRQVHSTCVPNFTKKRGQKILRGDA